MPRTTFGVNVRCYVTIEHEDGLSRQELIDLVNDAVPIDGTYSYANEDGKVVKFEIGGPLSSLGDNEINEVAIVCSTDPYLDEIALEELIEEANADAE
jgi:hypothetical protein